MITPSSNEPQKSLYGFRTGPHDFGSKGIKNDADLHFSLIIDFEADQLAPLQIT